MPEGRVQGLAALGLEQTLLDEGLECAGDQGHETKPQQGCTRSPAPKHVGMFWATSQPTGSPAPSTGDKEAEGDVSVVMVTSTKSNQHIHTPVSFHTQCLCPKYPHHQCPQTHHLCLVVSFSSLGPNITSFGNPFLICKQQTESHFFFFF